MDTVSITVQLPPNVASQLQIFASAVNTPVEDVLTAYASALPNLKNVPERFRSEIAAMTWMSEYELQQIKQTKMLAADQTRMATLSMLDKRSDAEEQELWTLREQYARLTLRISRAHALLNNRSQQPTLAS